MKTIEQINEQTAKAAWNANHFGDYHTGSCTAEYASMVAEARKIAENQKKKVPEKYHKKIDNLLAYYERKLAANINQRNSIDASYPSILICGAGGFSNRKKAKQNSRRDANYQEYKYIQSILTKIKSIGTGGIMSGDADALEQLRDKLAKLEARQDQMKRINAYFRKNNSLDGCPDLSDDGVKKINEHMQRFGYNKPCPSYELTNNNANIRRIRERIETLEREKNRTAETISGDGWQLVENPEIMRIQFIFDDKPDAEIRNILKRNGFRWAPSEGAWQRTLNNAGRYAAKDVMKQLPQAEPAEDTEAAPEELAPAEVPALAEPHEASAPEYEFTSYSKNNIDFNYIDNPTQNADTTPTPAEPAPVPVPEEIKLFEVGKTYQTRSICNNECIISITVTARTDKTITVIEHGETKRLKINEKSTEYHKAETVYPWGHYSMAPQIHADQMIDQEPPTPDHDPEPDPDDRPEIVPEAPALEAPEDQTPTEEITAAPEDQTPTKPAAPAPDPDDIPEAVTPEPPKTTNRPKRHAAPSWVGVKMTAYPRETKTATSEPPKSKKPDFVGRKMVITIGERSARPA